LYSEFVQFWFLSTLQWHHTATAADEQRLTAEGLFVDKVHSILQAQYKTCY